MGAEIVHHHQVAGPKLGHDELLDVGLEDVGIEAADQAQRRDEPLAGEACTERDVVAPVLWDRAVDALVRRRTAVGARHRQVDAALVEEDQPATLPAEPTSYVRVARDDNAFAFAFRRKDRLFFRDKPMRFTVRRIAGSLTAMPRSTR